MRDVLYTRAASMSLLFLLAFTIQIQTAACQKIFISQVPGYSQLSNCAAGQVSAIVRDMSKGCGDGGRTTSFSCFCTASSSAFGSIISTAVKSACSGTAGNVTEALDVFQRYCRLGRMVSLASTVTAGVTLTLSAKSFSSLLIDTSPTPALTPALFPIAPTAQPTATAPEQTPSDTSNPPPPSKAALQPALSPAAWAGISAGAGAFLCIIAALCVYIVRRRRQIRARLAAYPAVTPPPSHPRPRPGPRLRTLDTYFRRMGAYFESMAGRESYGTSPWPWPGWMAEVEGTVPAVLHELPANEAVVSRVGSGEKHPSPPRHANRARPEVRFLGSL